MPNNYKSKKKNLKKCTYRYLYQYTDIETYRYDRDMGTFQCVEFDVGWSFKTGVCLEPIEVKEKRWKDACLEKT